jgi:hypothetical protein
LWYLALVPYKFAGHSRRSKSIAFMPNVTTFGPLVRPIYPFTNKKT